MSQHPIEGLMDTAMRSIKEMVDVNTIIGDTIQTGDGTYIIPVSRVSFGFASAEVNSQNGQEKQNTSHNAQTGNNEELLAGGSAAGVSISPVAFMTVTNGTVNFCRSTPMLPLINCWI